MNLFLIFTIIAIIPSYSTAEESRLQTNHVTFADPSSIEGKSAMTVLSPPAILSNNVTSSAPSTSPPADPSDHTGSEWSKMVIGYTMLSVAALIVNWSLWVFRKELLDGCKKVRVSHTLLDCKHEKFVSNYCSIRHYSAVSL